MQFKILLRALNFSGQVLVDRLYIETIMAN